jgi:hypothetical protein
MMQGAGCSGWLARRQVQLKDTLTSQQLNHGRATRLNSDTALVHGYGGCPKVLTR